MAVTPNYNFELIDFDKIPWHEREHDNWRIADAVFANFIVVTNLKGVWQNAIAVTVGQKYVDAELGTIWEALVAHTTPSTGTFAASRTAVPANWTAFTVQVTSKGLWTTLTVYSPNDFVQDSTRFGIVQAAYTSGASYDADVTAGNIITLVDIAIKGTSTTSLTIGTGTHTFVTQANLQFIAGDFFIATSDASAANFMFGTITTYSTTSLTVNTTVTGGSGAITDWTIRVSGARGATGATGATGAAGAAGSFTGSEAVVVAALDDHASVFDTSDSNDPKRVTVQTILDGLGLVSALGVLPAAGDKIAMADVSDNPDTAKTVTVQFLFDAITSLTAIGALGAIGDKLALVDISDTPDATKTITLQFLFDTLTALAELSAAPAVDDKLALVDISDTPDATKTITIQELFDGADGLTDATITASDKIVHVDAGDSAAKTDTVQGIIDLIPAGGFTLGTEVATTSGSSALFSSIPAGTTMITMSLVGVSDGVPAGDYIVQIGDSGGLETSGYVSSAFGVENAGSVVCESSTNGFRIAVNSASGQTISGTVILTLEDASDFTWTGVSNLGESNATAHTGSGTKSLSAELTQVALLSTGTFDAGVVNISYQ
jgi:hypothetical protein